MGGYGAGDARCSVGDGYGGVPMGPEGFGMQGQGMQGMPAPSDQPFPTAMDGAEGDDLALTSYLSSRRRHSDWRWRDDPNGHDAFDSATMQVTFGRPIRCPFVTMRPEQVVLTANR